MKVIVFGATGMVGQGVLHECLAHPDIDAILVVGRSPCGVRDGRLREIVHGDLYDYTGIESELAGYDACFFCLGVSAAGMTEGDYHHVTYDLTLAAAKALLKQDPGMTFIYVSGAGTDGTERGGAMWARVKGKTENALLGLGFKSAYMFRPGYIQPMRGVRSRTGWYRAMYVVLGPLYPVLKTLAPNQVTTSEHVGRAMIRVAQQGYTKTVVDSRDINALAG